MVMLRCSQSLLKRLRRPIEDKPATSCLGDWYARPIFAKPRHVVLCTNERSLLCFVIPLAPIVDFIDRFRTAATHRIRQIPAPPELLDGEQAMLAEVSPGRARSRSVISTMNHFTYGAKFWLDERPDGDLEELGLWLCDTPCSAISTDWPWLEAELALTGSIAPGRRGLRFVTLFSG